MGLLGNLKDIMAARNQQKKIEAMVAKLTAEYSNGGITAVARGDMHIEKITVAPEAYDEVKAGKPARFETMLTNVVNGALKNVRTAVQAKMIEELEKSGTGDLFGR